MEGTVKWFSIDKGFGFIQGEDGNDYFVHHTAVKSRKTLRENDRVSFTPVESERGKRAQDVEIED